MKRQDVAIYLEYEPFCSSRCCRIFFGLAGGEVDDDELVARFAEGESVAELARAAGTTTRVLAARLDALGVDRRTRAAA